MGASPQTPILAALENEKLFHIQEFRLPPSPPLI